MNNEIEKPSVVIPPMHATGSLTVDSKKETEILIVSDDASAHTILEKTLEETGVEIDYKTHEEVSVKKEKWEPVLPEMSTTFHIGAYKYKVCFINAGKGRFSAVPCK